ncbi:L-lactate permease [Advenella sp. FME57]|uniref:L-lactate permease n=1 Tax=Advenella sp. FME57 TaxID=2742604 RepID=UPI0018688667|nr:L-lactate permease [Advenella sp. FME57]
MTYFIWSLPALIVLAAIVSGRANATVASVLGLGTAIPVAIFYGPGPFDAAQLTQALLRGLWIGVVIAPYILGGLLFWQVAASGFKARQHAGATQLRSTTKPVAMTSIAKRRLVFFACFLIGPFAEAATGFGVGMLGTIMLLRHLGFAPLHLIIFALLSQSLIPWGAMASGTLLAAAYANLPSTQLSMYVAIPVSLLMLVWLSLFWKTARKAGIGSSVWEGFRELLWVATGMVLLLVATRYLGPETALLAAYGPLIVIRYLLDVRPARNEAWRIALKISPYIILIGGLAVTRLVPVLKNTLTTLGRIAPFDNLPAWSPLLHAGTWLIGGALLTAIVRKQTHFLKKEAKSAWFTGQHAVLTVFLFSMMAEVLAASGISGQFATATFNALSEEAILITPILSGMFGVLTNSGNPANSLFLPPQVALAVQAGLSVPAVAALQHVSGTSLGFFSPIRMSIAASLAGGRGQEKGAYMTLFPFALVAMVLLIGFAMSIIAVGTLN